MISTSFFHGKESIARCVVEIIKHSSSILPIDFMDTLFAWIMNELLTNQSEYVLGVYNRIVDVEKTLPLQKVFIPNYIRYIYL